MAHIISPLARSSWRLNPLALNLKPLARRGVLKIGDSKRPRIWLDCTAIVEILLGACV